MSGEENYKETGQYAYEAYGRAVEWTNFNGEPMRPWHDLTAHVKDAWREAAHAAIRYGWDEHGVLRSPGRHSYDVPPGWQHIEEHD